jgi:hypothetical protein
MGDGTTRRWDDKAMGDKAMGDGTTRRWDDKAMGDKAMGDKAMGRNPSNTKPF